MAWNEPGGSGNKDPWGVGGRKQQGGPPDLDEMLRKFQQQMNKLFGGKRADAGNGAGGATGGENSSWIGVLVIVALIVWAITGIYIIDPAERGVVLRFGKYVDTTGPGPHWYWPYPIGQVKEVNVDEIRNVEVGFRSDGIDQALAPVERESLMLTKDENIVDINLAVQYRVKDAREYLFNVRDPDATLVQATESAVREVIGKNTMDFVLTEGRTEIATSIEALNQKILDSYNAGLQITSVNIQNAQPPEEVQDSFRDVVRAREDEQRLINEAQAYSNDIIPRARGGAARRMQESQAYRSQVVAQAEGEASRFSQILTEYQQAPEITRKRLYLESMESVLSNTSKIMLDVEGGNNVIYLPLDRIMQQRDQNDLGVAPPAENVDPSTPEPQAQTGIDPRDRSRSRGVQ